MEWQDLLLIVKGVLTGLAIAVPVGPIGVVCLQRTLVKGRKYGLVSGLGAASADALCGFAAGFGMYFLQDFFKDHSIFLQVLGGLVVLGMGIKTWFSRPVKRKAPINSIGLIGAFSSVFFLALTNPITFFSIAAMFFGLGVVETNGQLMPTAMLVFGVFIGSNLWWVLISGGLGLLRKKINHDGLRWISKTASIVLLIFSVLILLNLLRQNAAMPSAAPTPVIVQPGSLR